MYSEFPKLKFRNVLYSVEDNILIENSDDSGTFIFIINSKD